MTFINDYLDYATPQTGAPRQYHFYAAYAILATVIGKRATYHGAGGPKGPNLWMVVLGPSSMAYKSTVTNIMSNILRDFYEPKALSFSLPSSGSYESFIEILSERPQGIIINDEFVSAIDWMNKTYNGELTGLLTKIYDYGAHTLTRRVGTRAKAQTYTITDPFVNAFYCSTFEWFNAKLNESLVIGGFVPRHILIHVDEPSTEIPRTPPADLNLRDNLIETLNQINDLPFGPMDYTKQAGAAFDDWFKEYVPSVTKDAPPLLQPMIRRRLTDTHKFAMIHAVLRGSPNEIILSDLTPAISITESLVQCAASIVSGKITFNEFQQNRQRVIDIIARFQSINGTEGAPRHMSLKSSKLRVDDFDRIIHTIEQENIIEIIESQGPKGRKAQYYKLLEEQ